MQTPALLRHVVNFCYPGVCACCDAIAGDGATLCPECTKHLHEMESAAACERCAMPVARDGDPCPHCEGKGVYPLEKIVRLGVFDDPIRHIIHQAKYHRRWPLAEFLAERLFEQERVIGLLQQSDVLVPVPLHTWRHIKRGYNQADVIARRLAKRGKLKTAYPVDRLRPTETQTHLHSQEKREENIRDAFGLVDERSISGKHVVIIDDVMTTGATLKEVARVIRDGKAASICAIVVAIADPKRRGFEQI